MKITILNEIYEVIETREKITIADSFKVEYLHPEQPYINKEILPDMWIKRKEYMHYHRTKILQGM